MKRKVDKDTNFDGGKNRITEAGKYHLVCIGPEDGIELDDQAKMEFKVVSAVDPSQLDKTVELRVEFDVLFPSDDPEKLKTQQRMVDQKIAYTTSAMAMVEMGSGEVATLDKWRGWIDKEVEFNFEQALGRQIVAEVDIREFDLKDKETGQPTGEKGHVPEIRKHWTILSPVDPKAASYPLNPKYVEMLGGTVPPRNDPPEEPPTQGQPAKPNPPSPGSSPSAAEPAAADDPWASVM